MFPRRHHQRYSTGAGRRFAADAWLFIIRAKVFLFGEGKWRQRSMLFHAISWSAFALAFMALMLLAVVFFYSHGLPDPRQAGLTKTPPNLTILASDGRFLAERGMRRGYVRYAEMPRHLLDAAVAAEDRRFRYHFGFDPIGMTRAALRNWRAGEVVEGGSTITQQLAKNLFLRPNRTWTRKVEEIILALWLESRYTKAEILELYFNRIYFGAGNYGVAAAAYHYFGKEPRDLTLQEASLLVGLIKAPSQYSPTHNVYAARERARLVLKNMAETQMITWEDYGLATAQPASFQRLPTTAGYEHLVDWIVELVPDLAGDIGANVIVETTIDPDMQQAAWAALKDVMSKHGSTVRASEAAVVAMTPQGGLRVLIGGMNYQASQFNRAVHARRQPGSAFKPFIYLPAVEAGAKGDDTVVDAPVEFAGWKPGNYAGIYRGRITLRRALADSSNMVAVRLTSELGLQRVIAAARRLGITTDLRLHPTLALGASDVTLVEMTGAYASFANGGYAAPPYVIQRIRDENGKVLYERSREPPPRVIAEPHAAALNDMLHAVVESGTGRGGALPGQIVAAKTGTSQRYRDAWFVGFTPYYAGGVWMGNDNNGPMRGVTGGSFPAEIWRRMMVAAHEGLKPKPLLGVQRVPVKAAPSTAYLRTPADVGQPRAPQQRPVAAPQPAKRSVVKQPRAAKRGERSTGQNMNGGNFGVSRQLEPGGPYALDERWRR